MLVDVKKREESMRTILESLTKGVDLGNIDEMVVVSFDREGNWTLDIAGSNMTLLKAAGLLQTNFTMGELNERT